MKLLYMARMKISPGFKDGVGLAYFYFPNHKDGLPCSILEERPKVAKIPLFCYRGYAMGRGQGRCDLVIIKR